MRKRRIYRILTFHTTTEAMAMEKSAMQHQIPGRLIPIPTEITAGCGLAWRMPTEEYPLYEEKIRELGLNYDKAVELMI